MTIEFTLANQTGSYLIQDGDTVFHQRGNVLSSTGLGFISDPNAPASTSMELHIDGQVYSGESGVYFNSAISSAFFLVTVGASGVVVADSGWSAINVASSVANITNNGEIRGGTGVRIVDGEIQNNGIITGSLFNGIDTDVEIGDVDIINTGTVSGALAGVYFAKASDSICELHNSGAITGQGIGVDVGLGVGKIMNIGTIIGGNSGIATDTGDLVITNAGTISGEYAAIRSYRSVGNENLTNTVVTLNNSGDIVSNGTAISLDVTANPLILETIASTHSLVLFNSGLIQGNNAAIRVTNSASNKIENSATGVISGDIDLGADSDRIDNGGLINGAVLTGAGNDVVRNTGTIRDGVDLGDGLDRLVNIGRILDTVQGGADADEITNRGEMEGVTTHDGDDFVTNSGSIFGTIDLGGGHDTYHGRHSAFAEVVMGGSGHDSMTGGTGDDTFFGDDGKDFLAGHGGDDALYGGNGTDTLLGGQGNDVLYGGSKDDQLNGGRGDDTLTGGSGADVFVFEKKAGDDQITDFSDNVDDIDISAFGVVDFAALQASGALSETTQGVVIDFKKIGGSGSVQIDNMTLAQLDAGDFIF